MRTYNPGRALFFLKYGLWTDSLCPLLEESGTLFPEQALATLDHKGSFSKRSLRHVGNICIAQHGLKLEPKASISPPCKFFKAKQTEMWTRHRAVSFYSPHSAVGYRQATTCYRVRNGTNVKFRAVVTTFHSSDSSHLNSIWNKQSQKQALPICIMSTSFSYW